MSDMAGPSGTTSRHSGIPRVPRRDRTCTIIASATSKRVVTNVPNGDEYEAEFKSESETNDDDKGENAHAISTSSSSDD